MDVLKDCIDIFTKELDKVQAECGDSDRLILDNYIPADGDYIIVKKDGTLKKCLVKLNKKERVVIVEGDNSIYDDIKFYDYHSRLVSMDKPQDPKKVIHSNNYLSFWVKQESFENGKLDEQAVDRYFDVLKNPRAKYKNAQDSKMYDYIAEEVGDVNQEKLESCRDWIKQNIFKFKDMQLELTGKNYLKVFFEENKDLYIKEEQRYLMTKIYNKNDYNIEINGQIYGLPNDNLALNSKKPYMEHRTRKNTVPYLLTPKEAVIQRKFFDYLMNEANKGNNNLFFDNSVLDSDYRGNKQAIKCKKNSEFIEGDFSGFFLNIQKGKEVSIQHQDTIVDYKYNLQKIFKYVNVLEPDSMDEQYKNYHNKKELLGVLNEVLFSKWLSGNFFSEEDKINADVELKRNILLSRDAIFAWLYKEQREGIERILHLVSMNIIKDSIMKNYIGKAIKQFNLMKSLEIYFGGYDMADKYFEVRNSIKTKINQAGYCQIDSESEYFYAVGQLVAYYISLSKTKDKKHSLANPFFNASSDKVLKSKLEQFFKKYNYTIDTNKRRFNQLYSMIMAYKPEGKVNSEDIIAGYISNNLIYESNKKEED